MRLRSPFSLGGPLSLRRSALAGAALALLSACGAHSSLPFEDTDAGAASGDASASERSCPPECAIGHMCCQGGCDGPPVAMPSDCCTCLKGEISSGQCPNGACGK